MFYYVENRYGTAGMGNSYGYASVVVSKDDSLQTYRNQTGSLSGPYTEQEAYTLCEEYNREHDSFSDAQND